MYNRQKVYEYAKKWAYGNGDGNGPGRSFWVNFLEKVL